MKVAIFSDLHIEHIERRGKHPAPLPTDADAVILAGDVHRTTHGLTWARAEWPDRPIVYVPGNHEFYGTHLFGTLSEMRRVAAELNIHLLSNNSVTLGDVRVLGTPLWTDFALGGTPVESARLAEHVINDFRVIREDGGPLTTRTMRQLHGEATRFLKSELQKPWQGRTVVVTHWLPHPECIAQRFKGSDLSAYFCADCSRLLDSYQIDLWVFGHSHGSMDFVHPSGCRIISNQRGYSQENPFINGFRTDCTIAI